MAYSGRRMLTCHHEAGHILTYWYFGYPVDWCAVLTVAQVRAGVKIKNKHGELREAEALMQANDVCRPPFRHISFHGLPENCDVFRSDRERRRDVELVNLWAGISAEAAYSRKSSFGCMLAGGMADVERANNIIRGWYPDETRHAEIERLAERRAAALVRSPHGAAAIAGLAQALFERGRIGASTIRTICKRAFQGRQARDADWLDHWPPTLQQIRAGYLPAKRS